MKASSRLQEILSNGEFAVTAECGPPRGANPEVIRKKGELLKGWVDAVNVTDNQTAIVRMSSIAACAHLLQMGLEPVMQMVTRDRNRIALQSDIMGAYSLGIKNILCLSGDHQSFGSQPDALNVFDIDSMNLIRTVQTMREDGKDMSGFELNAPPSMFIGAAANPFADPFEYRVIRLAKKIDAGADFIQTQCIYNMDRFKEWMKMAREEGLTEKVHILGGVTPLKSAGMAKFMNNKVAGMDVPEALIDRMAGVSKEKAVEEGLKICLETIAELREIEGIHGVHIMAIEWEEIVAEIVESAGLTPRP
ncbi:MAG: methylenetetrahydrofolate reductase [Deltaproteobacteria bacterium]|nr:methylenetetrahydrofolate reductase [Deltaproteobacteria bacterium]MBW1749072.1 methylenetetrahydrofolate reductase [Deltaproteobacteria bacterium]MBW1825596.1 methylenetetrahydrofolate reductase [Deltaproteobacteria bacterium]MBW1969307.1 methylenetetrahydrofolate reductase [Deltaproteobacteria bacterium]MBW2156123.1 methylenetetrahydrofolate reductase [Deltaproteobacteria bacterium]